VADKIFNCPGCGAFNTAVLENTTLLVCKSCSGIVFENVDSNRKPVPARVPADWSFVQLNTTGEYDGSAFTVVGRVRLQLRNDYKNFWCCALRNGKSLWVMESFASFAVFIPDWIAHNKGISHLHAGASIQVRNFKLRGEYVEKCEGVSYEGEIAQWKLFSPGFFFVQASRFEGETAAFVIEKGEIECMLGKKVDVQKLNLKNIIAWNEWK
jgi:hypothetical protein